MSFLLVHGAFRGGWAWGDVAPMLRAAGHRAEAPSLLGMGELAPPPQRRGRLHLEDWCNQLGRLAEMQDMEQIVLVGHSQGGLVIRAAAERLGDRLSALVYLDAPIPQAGMRGVDLSGPRDDSELPPPDAWMDPPPLLPDDNMAPALCDWINPRLGPTPVGPSLDPVTGPEPSVALHVAFCAHTPPGYPSSFTRAEFDSAGRSYDLFDAPHDVALSHPGLVADWLCSLRADRGSE